ncbi:N-acetyl-gamma-glutamyl-phosphate reductase [Oceanibaculum pacificum]|uniref:N-acetyl-gamma-glutamyl-phosphate reductase n=1 Tax=Oceanibaculum pacificum TaxID=580166 RepID=A0A154WEX6_9PROT|nr:N-acetyl-gamma-glutamyl-phosphate reductase [Oceanibaculum pacificum]KZD12046.1 N-acetyl-gamma-glutamyl-phosphate reductase [Oceanibaculum pacificum]
MTASNELRVGILGASGYTGAELIRLLAQHPSTRVTMLTGDRAAGKPLGDVFPHLAYLDLPILTKIEDAKVDECDLIFCALPHGTTQEVIAGLPKQVKVVDLSADFRLHNVDTYAEWYGHAHQAPELQKEAVYGITELAREAVAKARLVANPGCYPTAAQLPLVPLVEAGLIDSDDIIIDAKSGVSGAGRAAKEGSLFTEVAEGIHAYGVASHRHAPEIEQGLTAAAGREIRVNFTPHLMPMSRGILSTAYVKLEKGASAADLRDAIAKRYEGEPFVRVLPLGQVPATRHVRGSNHTLIGVVADRLKGRAIVISVIDNLVKGASGQAVQNMNVMAGLPETTALMQPPMFP